jgi:SNF2 family DNA or RNA helicase
MLKNNMHNADMDRTKIRNFLLKHATFSILDQAQTYLEDELVSECSKSSSRINGIVLEKNAAALEDVEGIESTILVKAKYDNIEHFSVKLDLISRRDIEANCSCSTREEMLEQWCPHACAVAIQAFELGFFQADGGFSALEQSYKVNTSSALEISKVINDVIKTEHKNKAKKIEFYPQVSLALDLSGDRLGVQVFFDDQVQSPTIFEGLEKESDRALDNVLIAMLEDEGSWDEHRNLWFVNSSKSIEIVLGLLKEYTDVYEQESGKKVVFSDDELNAVFKLKWLDHAVNCSMHWIMPNNEFALKSRDLIGTNPFWVFEDNSLFKVSSVASRIASVFNNAPEITLPRMQSGPILEIINEYNASEEKEKFNKEFFKVEQEELQPKTKIKTPKPTLELEYQEFETSHFSSNSTVEIWAELEFEYPTPKDSDNVVFLPDRKKEEKLQNELLELGFYFSPEKKVYIIEGDSALDLLADKVTFSSNWKVVGLNSARKKMKFANLKLNVALDSSKEGPESADAGLSNIDWFDCNISLMQNSTTVPISMLFKNQQSELGDKWVKLDSGAYAEVPGGGIKQLRAMLGMLENNYRLSNKIKTKLSSAEAISLSNTQSREIEIQCDTKLRNLTKKVNSFDNIKAIATSKNFKGKLRPYQKDGLSWLSFLHTYEFSGILADEMGLGKTVQTLALLQHLKDSRSKKFTFDKPAMIVAPTSVITNWLHESARFSPKLKVLLLHGPQRKTKFKEIKDVDLVITSYALLRIDRYELEKNTFSYIILDEAQNIKNPQAATTRAAKAIKSQFRLALSGTPTENRPVELWSIFDFLMPGYLGSYDFFRNHIEKPILESGPGVQVARFLNTKTKPFILRRLKKDVEKDMPPKTESILRVPMTDSQKTIYAQILEEVRPKVLEAVKARGVAGASVSILAALLRLRQVCNHPNSIEAFKDLPGYDSGKLIALKELVLEALEAGRKILLFSQFREMLAIIKHWLIENEINHLYLDGQTSNRQELVDQFNKDDSIQLFLMSLKAGGTGINLTGADTVIIYDPWWNPAVESQAVDRAHRIGQKKAVSVYRLVTEDSIEQKIMELKAKKSQIVDALIDENGLSTIKLTKEDLESFFMPISVDSLSS